MSSWFHSVKLLSPRHEHFRSKFGHESLANSLTLRNVEAVINELRLQISPGITVEMISREILSALSQTTPDFEHRPTRQSNREIGFELTRIADSLDRSLSDLENIEGETDLALWSYSWQSNPPPTHPDNEFLSLFDPSPDYQNIQGTIDRIKSLSALMRQTAASLPQQHGPWRAAEMKRWRVYRGRALAPIFEIAFGETVSVNNYPNDVRHKSPTLFMEFYARLVTLAFGPTEASNLPEVLKAACQMHRRERLKWPPRPFTDS